MICDPPLEFLLYSQCSANPNVEGGDEPFDDQASHRAHH